MVWVCKCKQPANWQHTRMSIPFTNKFSWPFLAPAPSFICVSLWRRHSRQSICVGVLFVWLLHRTLFSLIFFYWCFALYWACVRARWQCLKEAALNGNSHLCCCETRHGRCFTGSLHSLQQMLPVLKAAYELGHWSTGSIWIVGGLESSRGQEGSQHHLLIEKKIQL